MKEHLKNLLLVDLTLEEAATINGGRRGRGKDDGPGHKAADDKGGLLSRRGRGRGKDDGPGHT
jgi:hypothetical protein